MTTNTTGKSELTETERTAPEVIYLNGCENVLDMREPFPRGCNGDEIGWSSDPALDGAVRYVRADLVAAESVETP